MLDLPADKNYPPDAVQCNLCGGNGRATIAIACKPCEGRGWLPAGHPLGRLCQRRGCGKPIRPAMSAVYCSVDCAAEDWAFSD